MSPIESCKINAKLSICLEKNSLCTQNQKLVQILISFLTQKKIHKLGISIISQKKLTYSIAKLYNSF